MKKLENQLTMKTQIITIAVGLIIGLAALSLSGAGYSEAKISEPAITEPAEILIITPTPIATPTIEPIVDEEIQSLSINEEKLEAIEYDPPESLEYCFTSDEIKMIERLVEAEATAGNIDDKMNVANVVINRYFSDEFPDTIKEVIFQKTARYHQFSCIADNRYYEVEITNDTREAVRRTFLEEDTTKGALYFCNQKDVKNMSTKKWFKSLNYIMTDKIGHSYYK